MFVRGVRVTRLFVGFFGLILVSSCGKQDPSFVEDKDIQENLGNASVATESEDAVEAERPIGGVDDYPVTVIKNGTPEAEIIDEKTTGASLMAEYRGGEVAAGQMVVDLNQLLSEKRFEMTRAYFDEARAYTQTERPRETNTFQQGVSASTSTELFEQNSTPNGVLDILVVIDSSGSMNQEQVNLSSKLNPLLSYVTESDWRIAVTTTDPNEGCLSDVINKGEANAQSRFEAAVQPGTNGSGLERGFLQAVNGLEANCYAGGWLRPNSTLAILIVSDEDNCSNGNDCGQDPHGTTSYMTDYLSSIREPGVNAKIFGLIWHPSQNASACSTAYNVANQYAEVIDSTGGTWGSICDADYTNTLSAVSSDIATILENQFALQNTPDLGTTTVKIDGVNSPTGWSVTGNVLTFTTEPPPGAAIEVTYDYGASPIYSSFALSNAAASNNLVVKVNGAAVNNYSYNAAAQSIDFAAPPAQNAMISVGYYRDLPLNKTFALGPDPKPSSIQVRVNNQTTTDFNFDGQNIVFNSAPVDAARIDIAYTRIGEKRLAYPYDYGAEQTRFVVTNLMTGQEVEAAYEEPNIVIVAGDFSEGDVIGIVDPDAESEEVNKVELDINPLTVQVSTEGGGDCTSDVFELLETQTGAELNLENCDFGTATKITIDFNYVGKLFNEFEVDGEFFKQPHSVQLWSIKIDGELRTDYEVEGNRAIFSQPLGHDAQVLIEVTLIKAL